MRIDIINIPEQTIEDKKIIKNSFMDAIKNKN